MRARSAWTIFGVVAVELAATLALLLSGLESRAELFGFRCSTSVWAAGFGTVGVLLATRRPRNLIGWLFLVAALGAATSSLAEAWSSQTPEPTEVSGGAVAFWMTGWLWPVTFAAPLSITFQLFPDGRFRSALGRFLVWGTVLAAAVTSVTSALIPGPLADGISATNPFGMRAWARWLPAASNVAESVMGLLLAGGCLMLVGRIRRSSGAERRQLQWVGFAAFLVIVGTLLSNVALVLVDADDDRITSTFIVFAVMSLPVAIGIAILRHGLFDIQRVISRTVAYAAVSAVLVGSYALSSLAIGAVAGTSDLVVAASTLTVAALFRPVLSRVQTAVDRRFNRERYDAALVIDGFARRLTSIVDLDTLATDLGSVAEATVHPERMSVWLR